MQQVIQLSYLGLEVLHSLQHGAVILGSRLLHDGEHHTTLDPDTGTMGGPHEDANPVGVNRTIYNPILVVERRERIDQVRDDGSGK